MDLQLQGLVLGVLHQVSHSDCNVPARKMLQPGKQQPVSGDSTLTTLISPFVGSLTLSYFLQVAFVLFLPTPNYNDAASSYDAFYGRSLENNVFRPPFTTS